LLSSRLSEVPRLALERGAYASIVRKTAER
jgi:hypothetical protein